MKRYQLNQSHALSAALIALIAACALWIGYITSWGKPAPRPVAKPAARQVPLKEIRLAPDFSLLGPDQDLAATTGRPLFNPARRPLQSAGQAGPARASGLPGGRYTLTGVSISDESRVAMLRDGSTNKTVRVEQNKEVGGMLVESITPTAVTLKLGDEREEIPLKIAQAPKLAAVTPPQPVTHPQPVTPQQPVQVPTPGQAAPSGALPAIRPLVRAPSVAAAPGASQAATDIASADPITEADVAERTARVQARRNRQSATGESAR